MKIFKVEDLTIEKLCNLTFFEVLEVLTHITQNSSMDDKDKKNVGMLLGILLGKVAAGQTFSIKLLDI